MIKQQKKLNAQEIIHVATQYIARSADIVMLGSLQFLQCMLSLCSNIHSPLNTWSISVPCISICSVLLFAGN